MEDIRKISIGPDYKCSMHYIIEQPVLNNQYFIHHMRRSPHRDSIEIWIKKGEEIILWKEISSTVPMSIEYNIDFQ